MRTCGGATKHISRTWCTMADWNEDESNVKTIENPSLEHLNDGDSPTLTSLIFVEGMKWLGIAVLAFLCWHFAVAIFDSVAGDDSEQESSEAP